MPDTNVPSKPTSVTDCLALEIKYAKCVKIAFIAGPVEDCSLSFKSFAECNNQHVTKDK